MDTALCHNSMFRIAAVQHGAGPMRGHSCQPATHQPQHDVKEIITALSVNFTHVCIKIYKSLTLLHGIEIARRPADRQ
jgi:hypothetical protein